MLRRTLILCASTSLCIFAAACDDNVGNGAAKAPALSEEFARTADALAAKIGAPGANSTLPPASDPAVQAFVEQSARALTALGTEALPVDGFDSFEALCAKTSNIVGGYAMAGTAGLAGAAQQQRMLANVEQLLDQMFTPLLFAAHCSAQHVPFIEGQVDPSDTGKSQAVKQVRDGVFAQVVGLLQMAGDPSLDTPRRQRIMELLAADASKFAVGLSSAQRQQIMAGAQEIGGTLPQELRAHAERLASEMQRASCGKICSMA